MIARQAVVGSVAVVLCATSVLSQRCVRPDTTGAWFARQHDWMVEPRRDPSDDTLSAALVRATGVDSAAIFAPQYGAQLSESYRPAGGDTAVLARLRTLAATRGSIWPTRSVVGPAGVRALWLLAQRDTALQRTVLHRMMESGPDEALAPDVAVLEDRVRLQSGRKQLYGSQLRVDGGKHVPLPIEDSAHVDLRRDAGGLPPLRQALCAVR